ncbi:unnamed protein product [Brassicogethes aeneus]|uniref:Protein FAM114A2 n=1 Tax=Brassicogethes aeneus TaxID=1431903 RepID=A0A9P0BE12_BRAAE|nr:unnamed protein product [Brassicogethes aeneus]
METSDSEYFESADEDFQSDEENTEIIKSDEKIIKVEKNPRIVDVEEKVGNLQIVKDQNMNKDNDNEVECSLENIKNDIIVNLEFKTKENVKESTTKKEENIVENLYVEGSKIAKDQNMNKDNISKEENTLDNIKKDNNVANTEKIVKKPEVEAFKDSLNDLKEEIIVKKPVKESKIGNKKIMKSKPIICEEVTKKMEEKAKIAKPEVKKSIDENLWDDDEIDWAKEEEISKNTPVLTKHAPNTDKLEPDFSNLWKNDDWVSLEAPSKEPSKITPQNDLGWGSWGTWGVSSILNTATASVSSLTTHVSQGISTVLETGIGVPDPEELARQHREDEEEIVNNVRNIEDLKDVREINALGGFGLGNWVSGVSHLTKLVESTGTKVISGGLDTLETIGKKTMEVLQDGDPGLKKKRAFLKLDQNKPILSQVLREAKEKSNDDNKKLDIRNSVRMKNYETLFDDHQGLVHLEALEMLSKQCDIKLETLSQNLTGGELTDMQETLEQVKELCELPEEDDDEQLTIPEVKEKINTAVSEINIPITYDKLEKTWEETESWLETLKLNLIDEKELHQQAIETLAQLTAFSVEQFHKTAELLLVKENRSTADEADSLVQLTASLIALIGIVAAKFSDKLNSKAPMVNNKESVNELITNVFFEASNSSSYIQDAFQLLIPVLQVGAV